MQSAWRVIDCTNLDGQLKYARGRLVVRKFDSGEENQVTDLPLADTAILLLASAVIVRLAYCINALKMESA